MQSGTFGRYKIVEELGRGAMGVVYRATDPLIGRTVAIKVINEKYLASVGVEAGEYFERFKREAEVAGRMSHPGIVKIFDLGPNYIAMEFIEGQTLAALIRAHVKQHLSSILNIVGQVAAALDYAHGQGIVHRDVKPANLMIAPGGTVKVMDFGLARIDSSTLTAAGEILGSASYMAPELVLGRPATPRSDVFSLGVVAYELTTGDRPFPGASISSIIHSIVEKTPKPVHTLNLNLPPEYDGIFARVLAKDPTARYPTAGAFAEALVQKRWADRDPTITASIPEVSADAETLQEGPAIREAALAAAAETTPSPAKGPVESPAGVDATVVMSVPAPSSPPAEPASPPTVVLQAPVGGGPPPRRGLALVAVGCATLLLAALVLGGLAVRHLFRSGAQGVAPTVETPPPAAPAEATPPAPEPSPEPPAPAPTPPLEVGPPPATAAPGRASLSVTSEPAGARVSIGRRPLGLTPLRVQLPPGRVAVVVERDGFQPWHGEVTLRSGAGESLRATLEAVPAPSPSPSSAPEVKAGDRIAMDDDVTPPRKISGDPPRLPSRRATLKAGSAVVEFTVTDDGRVVEPRIIESAGTVLDRACLDAVQRWRYEPATRDGVPVKVVQRTRFRFEFK